LKRLNKGNTLTDGCLSTTDPKESLFQWIRGNRGRREDMRMSMRIAPVTSEQIIGCGTGV
jgi:hypothetical protein